MVGAPVGGKAAALGFVLALAACGPAQPDGAGPVVSGDAAAVPPAAPAVAATSPIAVPAVPAPPAKPGKKTSAVDKDRVDPGRLKGLNSDGLRALMGDPGLLRRDPPAEVWQYHGVGCVVDVFLYDENGARRVAYVQVRPLGGSGRVNASECLTRIVRNHRQTG